MTIATDQTLLKRTLDEIDRRGAPVAFWFFRELELIPAMQELFHPPGLWTTGAMVEAFPVDMTAWRAEFTNTVNLIAVWWHNPDRITPALTDLGTRLAVAGVADRHYHLAESALLTALRLGVGPHTWTADMEAAWRRTYHHATTVMRLGRGAGQGVDSAAPIHTRLLVTTPCQDELSISAALGQDQVKRGGGPS